MRNSLIKCTAKPLLIIILILWATGSYAANDFYSLYQLAKQFDTGIKRSAARLSGAQAESLIVRSGLLPHLSSSLGLNYSDQTTYNQTTTSSAVMGFNYGVNASIYALNVPTLLNRQAAAKGELIEIVGGESARQDLMVRFADAYFSILKAQLDLMISQDETVRVKKVLEQNEAFLKAGTGDIIAVYEAKARYDSVISDLNRYESNLKLAEQKLSTLTGKAVSSIEDFTPGGTLGPQPDDLAWWLSTMEKRDPQIRQMREGLEKSLIEVKSVKAEYYPTLQASAGYAVSKGALYAPSAEYHQWTIGANMSLPIYSGGETAAKTQRANASERERAYLLEETIKNRSEYLKQSYYNLKYNATLLASLEQKVKSAETQLNAVRLGRTIGTRSAIDVLNSEQSYSVALRDYKSTLYDNVIKQIQLKSAAGILEEGTMLPPMANSLVSGTDKYAESLKELVPPANYVKPVEAVPSSLMPFTAKLSPAVNTKQSPILNEVAAPTDVNPAESPKSPITAPRIPVESVKTSPAPLPSTPVATSKVPAPVAAKPVETVKAPLPKPAPPVGTVKKPVSSVTVKPAETLKVISPLPSTNSVNSRNQTGIGVLVAVKNPGSKLEAEKMTACDLPGSSPQSQIFLSSLSRLNDTRNNTSDEYHINVFEKRDDWLKVVLSETGRAVWVQLRIPFKFAGWKEYFSERIIRMKPGLSNEYYVVSNSNGKEKLGVLSPLDTLTVISAVEDWALVKSDTLQKGWLRWRNFERQLLVNFVE